MIKKIASFWFIFCVPFMCFADEIHELCRLGEVESVYDVLEIDPGRIHSRDSEGNTPLHIAIKYNHEKLVRLLMDFGASVNERNNNNCTPLHFGSCVCIVNLLIDCGSDIDAVDNEGNTPLHNACRFGDQGKAKCLVENGANINALNKKNFTPLDYTIQGCQTAISDFLLENGAVVSLGIYKEKDGVVTLINLMETPPLIKKVKPVPPDYLHRVRIKGVVIFCIVLNEDGSVESAVVLSGHPLMRGCALEAVKQWEYLSSGVLGRSQLYQVET